MLAASRAAQLAQQISALEAALDQREAALAALLARLTASLYLVRPRPACGDAGAASLAPGEESSRREDGGSEAHDPRARPLAKDPFFRCAAISPSSGGGGTASGRRAQRRSTAAAALPTCAGGTRRFRVDGADHPLCFVYTTPDALSAAACAALVAAAELAAAATAATAATSSGPGGGSSSSRSGWATARHLRHPTTDVDCARDPTLKALVDGHLQATLLPLLAHCFQLPVHCLVSVVVGGRGKGRALSARVPSTLGCVERQS
jgi:hypothetical protein